MVEEEIQQLIDSETKAWNEMDAETLVSLFHPDMVWPWPRDENAHHPLEWEFPMGRFNRERWKSNWQKLFDSHELIHNHRITLKITVSDQLDGAFAVVEIDTLWRDKNGNESHWKGVVSKAYTKVNNGWKLIMHTGVLKY
jgi:ketosteroid isomerase-like protein